MQLTLSEWTKFLLKHLNILMNIYTKDLFTGWKEVVLSKQRGNILVLFLFMLHRSVTNVKPKQCLSISYQISLSREKQYLPHTSRRFSFYFGSHLFRPQKRTSVAPNFLSPTHALCDGPHNPRRRRCDQYAFKDSKAAAHSFVYWKAKCFLVIILITRIFIIIIYDLS